MPAYPFLACFCFLFFSAFLPLFQLAPEILCRAGHGRAADWWSLGALLYEMLTGVPPFYSRDREKLFQKVLQGDLHFPAHIRSKPKRCCSGF